MNLASVHEKTHHIALSDNLRYEPKYVHGLYLGDFKIFKGMDSRMIPLHKYLLCSLYNAIVTELWPEEVTKVGTPGVHDTELLW